MTIDQSDTILKKYEIISDKFSTFDKLIMLMIFQHICVLAYLVYIEKTSFFKYKHFMTFSDFLFTSYKAMEIL